MNNNPQYAKSEYQSRHGDPSQHIQNKHTCYTYGQDFGRFENQTWQQLTSTRHQKALENQGINGRPSPQKRVCCFCRKKFSWQDNLMVHIRQAHSRKGGGVEKVGGKDQSRSRFLQWQVTWYLTGK